MKIRSLMTAICVLATANMVSAAPYAYVANSGTMNVSVIDTATDTVTATIPLPDTNPTVHPYAYGVAVGSSGQNVYVGLKDTNEVSVVDAVTGETIKRIGLGGDVPGGLAVNDAETRLYVASNMSNTLIVIDITGIGAGEVGRVTLDAASISNPEGVVLNAAGTKAYVANASTGNIAVVDLDEANDLYVKSSTIALGSVQPMGLTLSADGTMLYTSSINGNVRAIKLSDKSVTSLTTGNGTIALAAKPDGTKVYAPSNSVDKLFVIDSSVTPNVVATNYTVIGAPLGVSITPDGNKLYLAMNGIDSVKVFDTSLNSVTSTITLPALAKPISLGNFMGPELPYTIAATNGANCQISPAGTVAVNSKGRTFNIAANTGTCEVKVDGVSVGQPSAYNMTNILDSSHTIDASQAAAGTYYTLTADWNPANIASRYLVTTPAGIGSFSKSAQFLSGTSVSIKANTGFAASNWTGACAGTSGTTCTITMDADKIVGADINTATAGGPFYNVTKGTYYQTFAECGYAASTNDYVKISSSITDLTTTGTPGAMVNAGNQWLEPEMTTQDTYKPMTLTITDVGITVDPSASIVL